MKTKMTLHNLALLFGAAALLSGCIITSVAPFYTSKDLLFEPSLLGQWRNEPDDLWKFEKAGTNAYRLAYTSSGKTAVMQAHLFKVNGRLFLDLFSNEQKDDIQPPPIPSHFLLRVFEFTPTVRLAPLDYDWLKELLEKEPKALRHQLIQGSDKPDDLRLVLTADTQELQQFVLKHLDTEPAWKGTFDLKRISPTAKSDAAATK
jgi:hypothetical protein